MLTPETIVAAARRWLGTRFHHQGRVKGVGCDCIGLVLGVADELGLKAKDGSLVSSLDEMGYARIPDGKRLQGLLGLHLQEIPLDLTKEGDVLLFRFDCNPQHVGFITDIGVIHCYAQARGVVEHGLDAVWMARRVAAYRFKNALEKDGGLIS